MDNKNDNGLSSGKKTGEIFYGNMRNKFNKVHNILDTKCLFPLFNPHPFLQTHNTKEHTHFSVIFDCYKSGGGHSMFTFLSTFLVGLLDLCKVKLW